MLRSPWFQEAQMTSLQKRRILLRYGDYSIFLLGLAPVYLSNQHFCSSAWTKHVTATISPSIYPFAEPSTQHRANLQDCESCVETRVLDDLGPQFVPDRSSPSQVYQWGAARSLPDCPGFCRVFLNPRTVERRAVSSGRNKGQVEWIVLGICRHRCKLYLQDVVPQTLCRYSVQQGHYVDLNEISRRQTNSSWVDFINYCITVQ